MIGRLATQERGFTLVEVLVAATMMIGVSGAALTTLTEFGNTTRLADAQNDAQQEARRALALMSQELRNLASPTNELPQAVERATASDLILLSVGSERPPASLNTRNTVRVRYCLDSTTATVWRYEQTWTTAEAPAAPTTTECSAAPPGWGSGRQAAADVSNGTRPLFTYNAADVLDITELHGSLFVDADPARRPAEIAHQTTVFLRNQNRGPAASFTATTSGSQILLNGSDSTDPEGKALEYAWYDSGIPDPVGEGIIFTYAPSTPGTHQLTLKVKDPAGLESSAPPQEVCIVGGDVTCP